MAHCDKCGAWRQMRRICTCCLSMHPGTKLHPYRAIFDKTVRFAAKMTPCGQCDALRQTQCICKILSQTNCCHSTKIYTISRHFLFKLKTCPSANARHPPPIGMHLAHKVCRPRLSMKMYEPIKISLAFFQRAPRANRAPHRLQTQQRHTPEASSTRCASFSHLLATV